MKITLITFIVLFIPFNAFLQTSGVLVLSGDADYYGFNKSEFVVFYNETEIGKFNKNGFFGIPADQKLPLVIKHPDFLTLTIDEFTFSKKNTRQSVFENISPEAEKKLLDQLNTEQLHTCTGSKKEDLLKDTLLKIDSEAHFPGDTLGGHSAFSKFIGQSIEYPQKSVEQGIQGKVYVSFIVEADGSITCIEIKKGVDYLIDKESLRVIKSFPKFIPAKSNGVAVPTVYLLPLTFKLN